MKNQTLTIFITAGAGGQESIDWCRMLRKMYEAWAFNGLKENIKKFEWEKSRTAAAPDGSTAIVEWKLIIHGDDIYDTWKYEHGIHSMTRIPPLGTDQRRHTSFVSVFVTPGNVNARPHVDWGDVIRKYILQPYKLFKDLRSGYETSEVEKVLAGDLPHQFKLSRSYKNPSAFAAEFAEV